MRKTIRRPDSEWRKLIEEFRNSGLTMYKWCTKEGISTTTFRRKLELVPTDVAEGKMKSAMSENFLEENAAVINDSSCGDVVSAETRDAESLEREELMDGIMLGVKEKTGSSKNRLLPELGVISRSCKSLYFVDTENMSGEPIACLLKGIDDSSKALLFYTKKSNYISYEVLGTFFEKRDQISLIACDCGTDNALDFQLVSVLGSLISDFMNKGLDSDIPELIIVSKDHGFDAVIKFWKLRGIRIKRRVPDDVLTSKKKATIDETDANNKLLMKEDKAKPNTEGRRSDVQEDEISRYYSSHPEYQQSMKAHLSCRVGAELIRHGIKLSKKPPVMDILMKNPTPEEKDFEGVCTADVAKLLMQVPADYIKMQREATYRQELKLH